VSLCRCGQSSKKPFCDSTHKTCGFQSMLVAFDLEPPAPKSAV
jgi:CDGSH-type Zn-finger protein